MRTRGRHLRWLAASVLAAVGLLAPGVATADAASVMVLRPSGNTEPVNLDSLLANPDVRDRAYTVRGEDGSATTRTITGVSLKAVLDHAKADIDQYRHAQVQTPSHTVTFSEKQARQADWEGGAPPVFYVAPDGQLHFLRPSASATDLNGADELVDPAGMTIALRLTLQLAIGVKPSKMRPKVGERVTFTATVRNAGAGEEIAITWLFRDDNRTGTGDEVQHTFRKKGTFAVMATVDTGKRNVSDVVQVEVGAAEEEPEAEDGQEDETGTVTSGSTGGTADGTGSGTAGTGTGGGGDAAATTATPAPTAETPEPKRPERERRRDEKPKEPAKAEDTTIPGEVRGELLVADTTPVAAPARESIVPEAEGPEGDSAAFGLPPAAWTGIGVGVALAAGFGLDRRRMRRAA